MATKRRYKQVNWKVAESYRQPPPEPRYYASDVPLSAENEKLFEGALEPGNLFLVCAALDAQDPRGYIPPPYPYLIETWNNPPQICRGSLAVYAGTIRVEERKDNMLFRGKRHAFIINGGMFITRDLNWFKPASAPVPMFGHY